jgi:predicted permease
VFSLVAVCTLGLGIGATTSLFALINGALFRPLPYQEPGELVQIWQSRPGYRGHPIRQASWDRLGLSWPEYLELREGVELLEEVGLHGRRSATLSGRGNAELLPVGVATASLFRVLGVQAHLGRTFLPGEDQPGAELMAILSHELWVSRFGSDPGAVGQTVQLGDNLLTIIGVLPPGFRLRQPSVAGAGDSGLRSVWVSFAFPDAPVNRGTHAYEGVGRLAQGATVEQAQEEIRSLLPDESGHPAPLEPLMESREEVETRPMRGTLLAFFGATGILLLIACGNVALLVTGEALRRTQEMATRASLGADRLRLARQLLTENVILGLLGAALGCLLAYVGTKAMLSFLPPFPRSEGVRIEPLVLLFACGLGGMTGLGFGLAPVATLRPLVRGGSLGARLGGTTRGHRRFLRALVAGQLALTTILLIGSGLLLRSLGELMQVDPGFRGEGLAAVRILATGPASSDPVRGFQLLSEVLERAQGLPGVESVSAANRLPFFDGTSSESFSIGGIELDQDEPPPIARTRAVLPGFHRTMGIPLLAGRGFSRADGPGAPPVMIINEEMARRYWAGRSPLGAVVNWHGREWAVIGIAGNVKDAGLDVEPEAGFAVPLAQEPSAAPSILLRTTEDPATVLPQLREILASVVPDAPVLRAADLRSTITNSLGPRSSASGLMTFFGISAALLALVGVFGMTTRRVAQQRLVLAVRMALGADSRRVLWMVLAETTHTALAGVLVGLLLAGGLSGTLNTALFGIRPRDPAVFIGTALGLGLAAILASLIPAWRAGRIHPMEGLRVE